jgi:hypothetical protein
MSNWTLEQYHRHQMRTAEQHNRNHLGSVRLDKSMDDHRRAPVSRERDLHDDIQAECERRMWWTIHSRMDRPTSIGKGVCDFIIMADGARTIYVECKSKTGKLSDDQRIFITWMKRLGHTVHVVTSFQQFLELIR